MSREIGINPKTVGTWRRLSMVDDLKKNNPRCFLLRQGSFRDTGVVQRSACVRFRQAFVVAPGSYVGEQWLLERDTMSIATVAVDGGVSSQSRLTTRMLSVIGLVPLEYRKSLHSRFFTPLCDRPSSLS